MNSKKDLIIDPIELSPYKIEYNSIVSLPDSLGGGAYSGFAAIEGTINNKMEIVNVRLMKLQLYTKNNNIYIQYYYGMNNSIIENFYPKDVIPYFYFLKTLIKTVSVKKVCNDCNEDMNKFVLMFRFK